MDSIAMTPPRTTSIRPNLDFNSLISSLFLRSVSLHSNSTLSFSDICNLYLKDLCDLEHLFNLRCIQI